MEAYTVVSTVVYLPLSHFDRLMLDSPDNLRKVGSCDRTPPLHRIFNGIERRMLQWGCEEGIETNPMPNTSEMFILMSWSCCQAHFSTTIATDHEQPEETGGDNENVPNALPRRPRLGGRERGRHRISGASSVWKFWSKPQC
jgi:hypothetical protein